LLSKQQFEVTYFLPKVYKNVFITFLPEKGNAKSWQATAISLVKTSASSWHLQNSL
jgi:hypothetical protein